MNKKILVVIVGPTAVGKTAVSIQLAKKWKSEIISADSRQFFKEMEIGTAKPGPEEIGQVNHHFINSLSIHDNYDVGKFERDAIERIEELFSVHNLLFLVGGSGLYVDAICNGLDDFVEVDSQIRTNLNEELKSNGLPSLQKRLKELDPEYYQSVDFNNPQRIIRALEVTISTGRPYSSFRKRTTKKRSFEVIKIGLDMERQELYDRINRRMDDMVNMGLFDEAERLFPYRDLNALQTVGYREIFGHLNGEYDKAEAIRLLKRNSRRYAKRQLTWFKRDTQTRWFLPSEITRIEDFLDSKMLEWTESKQ